MWRLESQHLSALRQLLLEHGQRRARAHGNDQLTRFVRDDSVQAPRVENVARERLASRQTMTAELGYDPAAEAEKLARLSMLEDKK